MNSDSKDDDYTGNDSDWNDCSACDGDIHDISSDTDERLKIVNRRRVKRRQGESRTMKDEEKKIEGPYSESLHFLTPTIS